jgi:hypothetical protein
MYPFEDANNNININQANTRVFNSLDEPDFGNPYTRNKNEEVRKRDDILDNIHKYNTLYVDNNFPINNNKNEDISNFFNDDIKNTSINDDKKYEYPKFY